MIAGPGNFFKKIRDNLNHGGDPEEIKQAAINEKLKKEEIEEGYVPYSSKRELVENLEYLIGSEGEGSLSVLHENLSQFDELLTESIHKHKEGGGRSK